MSMTDVKKVPGQVLESQSFNLPTTRQLLQKSPDYFRFRAVNHQILIAARSIYRLLHSSQNLILAIRKQQRIRLLNEQEKRRRTIGCFQGKLSVHLASLNSMSIELHRNRWFEKILNNN